MALQNMPALQACIHIVKVLYNWLTKRKPCRKWNIEDWFLTPWYFFLGLFLDQRLGLMGWSCISLTSLLPSFQTSQCMSRTVLWPIFFHSAKCHVSHSGKLFRSSLRKKQRMEPCIFGHIYFLANVYNQKDKTKYYWLKNNIMSSRTQ